MRITRSELREHLFKMVFQKEFHDASELTEQEKIYLEDAEYCLDEKTQNELLDRFNKVCEKLPEVDKLIEEAQTGWTLERMSKVDLSILRVAVFEMRFDEDIPEKVAINEAVELAKRYGGEESSSFINGVLAKLVVEA